MPFLWDTLRYDKVEKDNLPVLCPFACYYKCDFIDYDVTISPEAKH